jgi:ankyrin repeat protein
VCNLQGQHAAMELLLNEGASVSVRDRWGRTVLQEALMGKHEHAVTLLMQWSANVFITNGASLLCTAASDGDGEMVKMLLKNGVGASEGDYDQRTALHLACAEGHARVVIHLIEAGADVNATDRWGVTPIEDAMKGRHKMVVEMMFKEGVTIRSDACVSMMCEAASKDDVEFLQLLVHCGESLDSHLSAPRRATTSLRFSAPAFATLSCGPPGSSTMQGDDTPGGSECCG